MKLDWIYRFFRAGNLLIIVFLISFTNGFSQLSSEKGYYLSISNFTAKEYKARPQNWDIVEDKRGVLYFGNNNGILEYDGIFWNTISGMDEQSVNSLDSDPNGTIYAGGFATSTWDSVDIGVSTPGLGYFRATGF